MKYRLREDIDAFQWTGDISSSPVWVRDLLYNETACISGNVLIIDGYHNIVARMGDYLFLNSDGYPAILDRATFEARYVIATEKNTRAIH